MKVKFLDLFKINEKYRSSIDNKIKDVIDSGWYIRGKSNENFENEFSKFCGVKYAVGVSNGLDALSLIIKAYGFGKGDEIIVPSNTYIATILSISNNGCVPILVEKIFHLGPWACENGNEVAINRLFRRYKCSNYSWPL